MWTLCDTVHLVAVWIIIWVLYGIFDAVLDCLEQYTGIASLLVTTKQEETHSKVYAHQKMGE